MFMALELYTLREIAVERFLTDPLPEGVTESQADNFPWVRDYCKDSETVDEEERESESEEYLDGAVGEEVDNGVGNGIVRKRVRRVPTHKRPSKFSDLEDKL